MTFRLLTAFTFLSFIFIIVHMAMQTATGRLFGNVVGHIPYGDKTMHFLMMALFSFLLNGALKYRKINLMGKQCLLGSCLVAVLITLEECSQAFIPARNFEIMDLVCNYAGIYAGSLLLMIILPPKVYQTSY